ncbi:Leucyl aminopeptidase [Rippkaea orientalis PCC 8801]|uniref:Probable cytosol aminopeptidase n=1 Tax=Rippkaea orientalis (strain PCC 8801 / RF-1) TaxID=41431 RepID=AMPA_RIPO1|nr:leucyl aminopeptidase [Rippkaea orientalis]B7K4A4.1 RecName: Full=Probable cytosol aminopeptidase; AltName: Full=Leucine aminopeptidase; Short=LAP; AltName: Full=Leucyl aminopeptidase [Rippkaea orientalis PCC 8801]ACK67810.1 Leucyl aminopeptidase [Rippkaea orientalis PCC 8801]
MDIRGINTPFLDWTGDALALGIFEEGTQITGELSQLDGKLTGTVQELIQEAEFEGKAGTKAVTRVGSNSPIRKVMLVGLGKAEDLQLNSVREAAGAIARLAKLEKVKTLGINLPVVNNDGAKTASAIAEGILLALHQDNRFKSDPQENALKLENVDILGCGEATEAINRAQTLSSGVILARELVNSPANTITPVTFAETAQEIAQTSGLTCEILEQEDCEKLGMGSFLGVAKASDLPPKFIHLTYKPSGTPKKKLAIVGKSLTFDCGGLNLKVAGASIEMMKMDMGGGAATLGAAKVIGQLKPDVEVHFICAATENMISGRAIHPGDILTASNGKTIEVNNTDAEGRLTLADALVFAEKLEVDAIVDLATLTGACIIALGDNISGLWSTDQTLADQLKAAAETAGEKFWQMPLEEKYFEGLKSPIADMKNTGPRAGGSITAALFLKQFIKDTPWAHLDIAGPVWAEKENGLNNVGGTGFPVRTLVNWVLSF